MEDTELILITREQLDQIISQFKSTEKGVRNLYAEFALLMGSVTTGIISFALVIINLGLSPNFMSVWLRSWGMAFIIVIPAILLIAPPLERLVDKMIS